MSQIDKLVGEIKYELAKGQHTYSACYRCDSNGARSLACSTCLIKELEDLVGKEIAEDFVAPLRGKQDEINETQQCNSIEEQIELLQALKAGKCIEQRAPNNTWENIPKKSKYLFFNNTVYQVKAKKWEPGINAPEYSLWCDLAIVRVADGIAVREEKELIIPFKTKKQTTKIFNKIKDLVFIEAYIEEFKNPNEQQIFAVMKNFQSAYEPECIGSIVMDKACANKLIDDIASGYVVLPSAKTNGATKNEIS